MGRQGLPVSQTWGFGQEHRCGFCPLWNLRRSSGIGKVVTPVVTGAKWVAGGWLSSTLVWHMVEVHVCCGSFCCPRARAGLSLAVLQPRRSMRLGHKHWWKSHPAQQADLSGSAVLLSCFLCLETAFLSFLRYLGHLLGPKDF